MITRRNAIASIALTPVALSIPSHAQTLSGIDTEVIVGDDRFPAGEPVPTVDEYLELETALSGTASPYPREVALARQILQGSPTEVSPFDVAIYFQDLRLGGFISQHGPESPVYATEWRTRANPVIVSFFDATSLRTPNGDVTAWCAAFVNWCHRKAKGRTATDSAASSSFRTWGRQTSEPKMGDLVVFSRRADPGKGHVGYYVAPADTSGRYVWLLGGNQGPQFGGNGGEVNIKKFDTQGSGDL